MFGKLLISMIIVVFVAIVSLLILAYYLDKRDNKKGKIQ